MIADSKKIFLGTFLMMALCAAIYSQIVGHEFLNFDEIQYVTENPHVNDGFSLENFNWAFSTRYTGNWHPLTWLSHMLVVQIFGLNSSAHRLVNVALHTLNASLLLVIFLRMTGNLWRSCFVAAIFAVHPLQVESVAWIAARKDLLSAFFGLLSIWSYIEYVRRPCLSRYFLVGITMILGLLAKPVLVTWPFVFLLLDFWPLQRLALVEQRRVEVGVPVATSKAIRIVLEKLPLIAISIGFSAVAFFSQRAVGATVEFMKLPIALRVENALMAYCSYLLKMIYPAKLAVFYPHYVRSFSIIRVLEYGFVLAAVTLLVVLAKQHRSLMIGWLWYLGTLVPMIGLIQVGGQSMADRYMYLPMIGLMVVLTWGLAAVLLRWLPKHVTSILAMIVIAVFVVVSHRQAGYWKNSITLFSHAIEVTENTMITHYNLANAYLQKRMYKEAIDHYQEATILSPGYGPAFYALGYSYALLNKYDDARRALERAVKLNERDVLSLTSLGFVLAATGKYDEAINWYETALKQNPDHLEALFGIGYAFESKGLTEVAARYYTEAVKKYPRSAMAHFRLASLNARTGRAEDAIREYAVALSINPLFLEAHNNLANVLARLGRNDDAVIHYREALKLSPSDREIQLNLNRIRARQHQPAIMNSSR